MFTTHKLSGAEFDALAAGAGGANVVGKLKNAYHSLQCVRMRSIRAHVDDTTVIDGAWGLLGRAAQLNRLAVDQVLTNPNVGLEIAYCLRQVTRTGHDPVPAWVTVGHLQNFAAGAAILAGIDFDIDVVAIDGYVALPALGAVRIHSAERWQHVHASSRQGRVTIDGRILPGNLGSDSDNWLAMPRSTVGELTLSLDDTSPYRHFAGPVPPRRQSETEVDQWRKALREMWPLLKTAAPVAAEEIAAGLTVLVPRDSDVQQNASSSEGFGGVSLSLPSTALDFAVILVHEFAHSKMSLLHKICSLHQPDHEPRFHAPWRDDLRPLHGFLQGVYAHLAIVAFWRQYRNAGDDSERARSELARWLGPTTEAASSLVDEPKLTEYGHRLVATMLRQLRCWTDAG
jgi:HEXXH motif-containing protein